MVVVITGASDGIGKAVARRMLARGATVYGLSTGCCHLPGLRERRVDVTDREAVNRTLDGIVRRWGRIDLLILSAGVSLISSADRIPLKAARRLMEVNFWGVVYPLERALRQMKRQRSGRIVILSSFTGLIPLPYLGFYSSSKAALLAYAQAVDDEVRPYGIRVTALMPGGVRTDFTRKRRCYPPPDASAAARCRRVYDRLGWEEQTGLRPDTLAGRLAQLTERDCPPVLLPVGGIYRFYALALRWLPHSLLRAVVRFKYCAPHPLPLPGMPHKLYTPSR